MQPQVMLAPAPAAITSAGSTAGSTATAGTTTATPTGLIASGITLPGSTTSTPGPSFGSAGSTGSSGGTGSSGTTSPLPDNVSVLLNTIYQEYESGDLTSSNSPGQVEIQGSNVGIDVHAGNASEFAEMVTALQSLGMQTTAVSNTDDIVEGLLPIAQLPAAAQVTGSPAINPILVPVTNGVMAR
jgi:hypothetical protein